GGAPWSGQLVVSGVLHLIWCCGTWESKSESQIFIDGNRCFTVACSEVQCGDEHMLHEQGDECESTTHPQPSTRWGDGPGRPRGQAPQKDTGAPGHRVPDRRCR